MKKLCLVVSTMLALSLPILFTSCGDDGAYEFEKDYKNVIDEEAIGAAGLNKGNTSSGSDSVAVIALENTREYWQQKYNKCVIETQKAYNEYMSLYRKTKLTRDQKVSMYAWRSTFNELKMELEYIRKFALKHGFYIEKAGIEYKSI